MKELKLKSKIKNYSNSKLFNMENRDIFAIGKKILEKHRIWPTSESDNKKENTKIYIIHCDEDLKYEETEFYVGATTTKMKSRQQNRITEYRKNINQSNFREKKVLDMIKQNGNEYFVTYTIFENSNKEMIEHIEKIIQVYSNEDNVKILNSNKGQKFGNGAMDNRVERFL